MGKLSCNNTMVYRIEDIMNIFFEDWRTSRANNIARRQAAGETFTSQQVKLHNDGAKFASGRVYRNSESGVSGQDILKNYNLANRGLAASQMSSVTDINQNYQDAQHQAQIKKLGTGLVDSGTAVGDDKGQEYMHRRNSLRSYKPNMYGPADGFNPNAPEAPQFGTYKSSTKVSSRPTVVRTPTKSFYPPK